MKTATTTDVVLDIKSAPAPVVSSDYDACHKACAILLPKESVSAIGKLLDKFAKGTLVPRDQPVALLAAADATVTELKTLFGYPLGNDSGKDSEIRVWDVQKISHYAMAFNHSDATIGTEGDELPFVDNHRELSATVFAPILSMGAHLNTSPLVSTRVPLRPPNKYPTRTLTPEMAHAIRAVKTAPNQKRRLELVLYLSRLGKLSGNPKKALEESESDAQLLKMLTLLHVDDRGMHRQTYRKDLLQPGTAEQKAVRQQFEHLLSMLGRPQGEDGKEEKHPTLAKYIKQLNARDVSRAEMLLRSMIANELVFTTPRQPPPPPPELATVAAPTTATLAAEDATGRGWTKKVGKGRGRRGWNSSSSSSVPSYTRYGKKTPGSYDGVWKATAKEPDRATEPYLAAAAAAGGPRNDIHSAVHEHVKKDAMDKAKRAGVTPFTEDAESWNKSRKNMSKTAVFIAQLYQKADDGVNKLLAKDDLEHKIAADESVAVLAMAEKPASPGEEDDAGDDDDTDQAVDEMDTKALEAAGGSDYKAAVEKWKAAAGPRRLAGHLRDVQRPRPNQTLCYDTICALLSGSKLERDRVLTSACQEVAAVQIHNKAVAARVGREDTTPYPWSLGSLRQGLTYTRSLMKMMGDLVNQFKLKHRNQSGPTRRYAGGWFSTDSLSSEQIDDIVETLSVFEDLLARAVDDYLEKGMLVTSDTFKTAYPALEVFLALSPLMDHDANARPSVDMFGRLLGTQPITQREGMMAGGKEMLRERICGFQKRVAIRAARTHVLMQYIKLLEWKRGTREIFRVENLLDRMLETTDRPSLFFAGERGLMSRDRFSITTLARVSPHAMYMQMMHWFADASLYHVAYDNLTSKLIALRCRTRVMDFIGQASALPVKPAAPAVSDEHERVRLFEESLRTGKTPLQPVGAISPYNTSQFQRELWESAVAAHIRVHALIPGKAQYRGGSDKVIAGHPVPTVTDDFTTDSKDKSWAGSHIARRKDRRARLRGDAQLLGGVPAALLERYWNDMLETARVVTRSSIGVGLEIDSHIYRHITMLYSNAVTHIGQKLDQECEHLGLLGRLERWYDKGDPPHFSAARDAELGEAKEYALRMHAEAKQKSAELHIERARASTRLLSNVSRGRSEHFESDVRMLFGRENHYLALRALLRGCTLEPMYASFKTHASIVHRRPAIWCPEAGRVSRGTPEAQEVGDLLATYAQCYLRMAHTLRL